VIALMDGTQNETFKKIIVIVEENFIPKLLSFLIPTLLS
jgi:hypothetical protein